MKRLILETMKRSASVFWFYCKVDHSIHLFNYEELTSDCQLTSEHFDKTVRLMKHTRLREGEFKIVLIKSRML